MSEPATTAIEAGGDAPEPFSLRGWLRDLYFGSDLAATRFQLGLLVFDLVTVTFFLVANFLPYSDWILGTDLVIATGLALDFAARLYISPQPLQYLRQPMAIVDVVVLASLLMPALAPISASCACCARCGWPAPTTSSWPCRATCRSSAGTSR